MENALSSDQCSCYIEKAMERDSFKSAEEAVKFGLIDEVIQKRPVVPDEP